MAATCVGAGDSRLAGRTFRLCALDEASQVCFSAGKLQESVLFCPLMQGVVFSPSFMRRHLSVAIKQNTESVKVTNQRYTNH